MPQDRPPIPAEIERDVFVEAGHRCAVCGATSPLERAHIIPWNKSREHRTEDLICLCASCHARADQDKWGEKTLRIYKKNPWILRKNLNPDAITAKQLVTLRLQLEFERFDKVQQRLLEHALASFLGIELDEVKIMLVEPGSVIVTIELPEESALHLLALINVQGFDLLDSLFPSKQSHGSDSVTESLVSHLAKMHSRQAARLLDLLEESGLNREIKRRCQQELVSKWLDGESKSEYTFSWWDHFKNESDASIGEQLRLIQAQPETRLTDQEKAEIRLVLLYRTGKLISSPENSIIPSEMGEQLISILDSI